MKRLLAVFSTVALLTTCVPGIGNSSGPFDEPLSKDEQILQILNRLTYGPRPGDVEEVRRLGTAKWIEQQLHPDQIPENPLLEAKLKPLETLRMGLPELVKEYTPQSNMAMAMMMQQPQLNQLLTQEQARKVQIGTAEQRTEILKALDPEKRRKVLATLPPDVLNATPEYKKEGEDAVKARQEDMQAQNRLRNPQLQDILSPEQVEAARSGNKDQLKALFAYLDPDLRAKVARVLPPQSLSAIPELRRMAAFERTPRMVVSEDLREAKVFRALYSNRQLEEVLVDFWVNHFNVDVDKNVNQTQNLEHILVGSFERDAIRPHVLGHFKDLLLATARHPAMLYYLDNWESVAPGAFEVGPYAPQRGFVNGVANAIIPFGGARQAHGLNENYGREVMELHTLGAKGGYTQDDVIAVARCFTGWTVRSSEKPEYVFAAFMHDFGEKTVLGHKIAANGAEGDGLQVIDILAHHPSTAKFISRQLAQRFVADEPPQALVDRMAQTFTKTDGDLRAVLETMFGSPEFLSKGAWEAKVKSPFEMVVSAVRAVGADVSDTFALVQKIGDMGERLYNKLEPAGYPITGDMWLSTVGVMGRMNFSSALASGMIPGVKIDPERLAGKQYPAIAKDLLGREVSPQTRTSLEKGLEGKEQTPAFIASLVLSSPDFQRR